VMMMMMMMKDDVISTEKELTDEFV